MFDKILFPTDGSEGAKSVLDHALDVAQTHEATVHILTVADTTVHSVTRVEGDVVDALETQGDAIVTETADRATERGVSTVTEVLQGGVAETILDYADEYGMDLVIMPTRGRTGLSRLLLGSVTERVLRSTSIPMLTINPDVTRLRYPYENVLVPTDGSDVADRALEMGVDVVNAHGAGLHVLSVVDVASLGIDVHSGVQTDVIEQEADSVIEAATEYARNQSVESVHGAVEHGSAVYRVIQSYVDEHDVDLLVMGTHGRSGLDRHLLGGVVEKIVRTTSVPVLTVPRHPSGQ